MRRSSLAPAAALALLAAAAPARADGDARRLDVTPLVGAWIALGDGRQEFEDAPLAGVQASYDLDPHLALVGTFAWAASGAKRLAGGDLDLLQYDLGLRGQHAFALGGATTLRPFLGLGVGLRTFHFRDARHAGGTGFATYASAGAEVGHRALSAGLTVRHQIGTPDANALDLETPRQDLAIFAAVGLRL